MKRESIQQVHNNYMEKRGTDMQQNWLMVLWDRAQISRMVKI